MHETTTLLLVTLPNIHRFKKIFSLAHSVINLKHVAALPCNLSLLACFAGVNVSQGNVAVYARCGGIFNIHLTANLPRNLPVKNVFNRLRFHRIMVTSL